jgi:plastocyanin
LAALLLGIGIVQVATAQEVGTTAATFEGNISDINSWGFATTVPVGGTVVWTNFGVQAHTATSPDGAWDTGMVAPGASAEILFDTPGTYSFVCTPHPWMKGTVIVTADIPAGPSNVAMVEQDPANIQSWGFAASVQQGQAVTWTNVGSQAHSATSPDAGWDTGLIAPGGSATLAFDTAGTYAYVCTPHPWMKSTVVVNAVTAGGGGPPVLADQVGHLDLRLEDLS